MKNTLIVGALAATLGLAAAGNLRAPAKATLLERCTGSARATECCSQNKDDHKLYQKNAANQLEHQCCFKSMGMWMPTSVKSKDGFCTLGMAASNAKTAMANVNSLTDKMVDVLDRLNDEKHQLKKEFKDAYRAHELKEDTAEAKKERQVAELSLVNNNLKDAGMKLNVVKNELADSVVEEANVKSGWDKQVNEKVGEVKKADDEAKKIAKLNATTEKDLAKVRKEVGSCKSKNEKSQKEIDAVNKKFLVITGDIAKAKALEEKMKKDYEADKYARTMQESEAQKARDAAEKSVTKFKGLVEICEQDLADARKSLEKTKQLVYGTGASFLEIAPGACDKDCKEIRAWSSSAYIASKDEKMMDKAKNYVKTEIDNLHKVLVEIKKVKGRVGELKNLDVKLHKEIMADINKQSKALEDAIKKAERKYTEIQGAIGETENKIQKSRKLIEKIIDNGRNELARQQAMLEKASRLADSLNSQFKDLMATLRIHKANLADCKGVAKTLDADLKQATEAAAGAAKALDHLNQMNAENKVRFQNCIDDADSRIKKLTDEGNSLGKNADSLRARAMMLSDKADATNAEKKKVMFSK
jgi:chromosome segregation ATPase